MGPRLGGARDSFDAAFGTDPLFAHGPGVPTTPTDRP